MKLSAIVLAILGAAAMPLAAQSRDVASYDIEVALDPSSHRLEGSQTLRWRNTAGVATSEIWLHLYLNAFASSDSTFMRELDRGGFSDYGVSDGEWGWIRVDRLALADGTDLLSDMSFERPDDGNQGDFTVARVRLPRPVHPGEAVELELDFEAQLPRVVARTGHAGDFHMVAQWFPKVGVFEGEAGWNCHQFHAASEFFADFGSYRVRLTVPRGWVVGATGEQVSREPDGTEDILQFEAAEVHDFAWATAPPSIMTVVESDFEPGRDVPSTWLERAQSRLDLGAGELELPPARLRLLVPRSQAHLAPRMLRAIRLAMAWFGLSLGPYPYPVLTVVSPPAGAGAAGGMEYPTLFTTGASRLDGVPPLAWRSDIEVVTVHEFGHQYFQGLLASNEAEQAWLDEGLTTWAENRCLDDVLHDRLAPGVRLAGTWGFERLRLGLQDAPVTIDRRSWEHRRIVDTYVASYTKASLALRTLEGLLGEGPMLQAMRRYVRDFRYRHPTGADLQATLEASTGEDLEWFFSTAVRGSEIPDWAVLAVRQLEVERPAGMVWRDGGWRELGAEAEPSSEAGGTTWQVVIDIGRRGDLVGPVEVELEWADGRRERRRWDGRQPWTQWTEVSPQRLAGVVVDPDAVWALETRRADNYWRDGTAGADRLWWLSGALRFFGLLVLPWA